MPTSPNSQSPLDFNKVAKTWAEPALQELNAHRSHDDKTIELVNDRSADRGERIQQMQDWLRRYSVFQGIHQSSRREIATAVIEFADSRDFLANSSEICQILKAFSSLWQKCSECAPKNRNDRTRDITSLTSKALWICYPASIPLYDRYAVRALHVISKLMPVSPQNRNYLHPVENYGPFIDVWLQLYPYATDAIRAIWADESDHVRVFDKMLWLIGKETYGAENITNRV